MQSSMLGNGWGLTIAHAGLHAYHCAKAPCNGRSDSPVPQAQRRTSTSSYCNKDSKPQTFFKP